MTRHAALRGLLVLAGLAVGGVALGLLWAEVVWTPAQGQVAGGVWYPADERALGREASGTISYVIVAGLGGIVLGLASAALARRAELAVLAAVVVGSGLAAYTMWLTGTTLSPPDPTLAAVQARDGAVLPDDLTVEGASPFLALPVGALAVLATAFLVPHGSGPLKSRSRGSHAR